MSYPPNNDYAYPPGGGYPPQPPYGQQPYGAPPPQPGYGGPPTSNQPMYGGAPSPYQSPYGAAPPPFQPPYGSGPPPNQSSYGMGTPQQPYGAPQPAAIGFDGLNNQPVQPVGMPQANQGYAPPQYPSQGPSGGYGQPPQQPSFAGMAYAASAAVSFQGQQSGYSNQSSGGGYKQTMSQLPTQQPHSTQNTLHSNPTYTQSNSYSQEPPTQGTIRDYSPFNGQQDAEVLRKAMKGFGTDEKAITNILGSRSNSQRQKIKIDFATMFGKDLIKELKSELSGNYESTVLELLMPPDEYDAYQLYTAMKGLGTDEQALIEILCTRTNAQIKAAAQAFKKLYKNDLEKALQSETSGHFRRLLISLVQGSRPENQALDHHKAAQDAQALYSAGEGRWGTDESRFNVILASRSFGQLRLIFDEYSKISKRTIEKAIESEMSGDLKNGMLATVKCARNRPAFFAERLYWSMKGLGTDDRTLIRIMVSRSEIDMVQIKHEFQRKYSSSLAKFIQDDCSGDYKKLLLKLCG